MTTRNSLVLEWLVINNKSQEKISMNDEGQGEALSSAMKQGFLLSQLTSEDNKTPMAKERVYLGLTQLMRP